MSRGDARAAALGLALLCAAVPASAQDAQPVRPERDGPVLIAARAGDPFGRYLAEIARAEGLHALRTADAATLDDAALASHAVVVLTPGPVTPELVAKLSAFVDAGGALVAIRPDRALAELAGLVPCETTLGEGYWEVEPSVPGVTAPARALQFHGTADAWTAAPGTRVVATLRARRDATESVGVAATVRDVGTHGGHVAAFAFDLARSIAWTRQGNPAWAGVERDGTPPLRPDDLFYPDWVDVQNLDVPQADVLARVFADVTLSVAHLPLPRVAPLPDDRRAAIVLTADDHGSAGVPRRFDALLATRTAGCRVDDWSCTNATSYVWPTTVLTPEQAAQYRAQGFELGWHVDTQCRDWTADSLGATYTEQLAQLPARFPGTPAPRTSRTHCIVWSDWATQPKIELAHGIRLDVNYYHWPAAWLTGHTGTMTGSATPMRFADRDGTPIDVWQAATQMTDESGQAYPAELDALLDRAVGPDAYGGVYVANLHTDAPDDVAALAVVGSAQRHGAAVISADQLLAWLDARDAARLDGVAWDGRALRFALTSGAGAEHLVAWAPLSFGGASVAWISHDGTSLAFTRRTVRGVEVVAFPALPGRYVVTYSRRRGVTSSSRPAPPVRARSAPHILGSSGPS